MTTLNRIPVLDHGYVRPVGFCPSSSDLDKLRSSHFRNTYPASILDMTSVVLEIRCPYFILIPLVSAGVRASSSMSSAEIAYSPTVDRINSGKLESDREISESMKMTIESLMINQKAYVHDGCNHFVAALTTPVAAYWEGVLQGSLPTWIRFYGAKGLHPLVGEYQRTISQIISSEYKNIHDIQKRVAQ